MREKRGIAKGLEIGHDRRERERQRARSVWTDRETKTREKRDYRTNELGRKSFVNVRRVQVN